MLNERIASGKEIGNELGADVSSFYHHIEELERLDCIERIETRRRRGVDERGWSEATGLLTEMLGRLAKIRAESSERLAKEEPMRFRRPWESWPLRPRYEIELPLLSGMRGGLSKHVVQHRLG